MLKLRIIPGFICIVFLLGSCSVSDSPEETADTDSQEGVADEDAIVDNISKIDDIADLSDEEEGDDSEADEDIDNIFDECDTEGSLCVDYKTVETCRQTDFGMRLETKTCESGSGCLDGECVTSCSDECTLEVDQGCELYDLTSGEWLTNDGAASMHDRAREYIRYLQRDNLYHGGIVNIYYKDETYAEIDRYKDWGDSAMWTGNYLAAEALRLLATGSGDAQKHVVESVETLHLWFNVSGQPGQLSRYAAPNGEHPLVDWDCSEFKYHCGVMYEGKSYDYEGDVSRDQYTGVMLGMMLAYKSLEGKDETTRALIRDDVITLIKELMKEQTMKLVIDLNHVKYPAINVTMRFAIKVPDEMEDGAIILKIVDNDIGSAENRGFREFMPNIGQLTKQIPVLNIFGDNIPRIGSALMLTSFFRAALFVTEGVVGYESVHQEILDFYTTHDSEWGNVYDWIDTFSLWSYSNKCGDGYFANNITMEPLYYLAQLETIPEVQNATTALLNKMWPTFENTKNPFFTYISAANFANMSVDSIPSANQQLEQFPNAPRIDMPVDLRDDPRFDPHEDGCDDQANHNTAVDVGERVASDFLWQRNPWELYDSGNLNKAYPGTDYLIAYYMALYHGYLSDDSTTRCLRLK